MAFKNAGLLLNLAEQTVYTCPVGKEAVIHSIFVTPLVAQTTATIKCATFHVGKDIDLVYGGTLFYPKPANLEAGDTIIANVAVDGDAEIFCSILEEDA